MKKIITYKRLFLTLEKDFGFIDSIRFINRIRKFSPNLREALYEYLNNDTIPEIEIQSVSAKELIEKEQMSPIGALIMLDWIEKNTADAFDYMFKYRYSVPLPELNETQKMILTQRIKELREKNNIPEPEPESIVESDIELNTFDNNI